MGAGKNFSIRNKKCSISFSLLKQINYGSKFPSVTVMTWSVSLRTRLRPQCVVSYKYPGHMYHQTHGGGAQKAPVFCPGSFTPPELHQLLQVQKSQWWERRLYFLPIDIIQDLTELSQVEIPWMILSLTVTVWGPCSFENLRRVSTISGIQK